MFCAPAAPVCAGFVRQDGGFAAPACPARRRLYRNKHTGLTGNKHICPHYLVMGGEEDRLVVVENH